MVKVIAALFISPLAGGLAGALICRILRAALRRAHLRITLPLRILQGILLCLQGMSYGMNDAQKTMGILAAAFLMAYPSGFATFVHQGLETVPWWVKLISVGSIAVGALIGSASILKTLGKGVFNLHLTEALSVQAAVTGVVSYASAIGGPVSSGQVLASAIVGAGSVTRRRAVHWSVVVLILRSWVITIPGAALLGALLMAALRLFW
ncbi:MAG: inorganic phosphate transporter [Armatimonadota bacterium]|nr:inorganic phosphate transporter [Armatimonadota bacterium]